MHMVNLKLVNCEEKYWDFIRTLRMNESVVNGFITNIFISVEDQKKYMLKYNNNYYIAILDEQPVGFVGVIDDDIRICTHPDFQKNGIGKFMLSSISKLIPTAFGKIKINNESSKKLFESCGFTPKYLIYTNEKV